MKGEDYFQKDYMEHILQRKIMNKPGGEGRNMAGATGAYTHIPMFYSDLFDLGYEAVGEMSSTMEVIADWQEKPFKKGVIYYMDDGRVRGVLLWNVISRGGICKPAIS